MNEIFDKVYSVFYKEITNGELKPPLTFEEEELIIYRLQQVVLDQKFRLLGNYIFDEFIKPILEQNKKPEDIYR